MLAKAGVGGGSVGVGVDVGDGMVCRSGGGTNSGGGSIVNSPGFPTAIRRRIRRQAQSWHPEKKKKKRERENQKQKKDNENAAIGCGRIGHAQS